eukprot:gene19068-20983_t
MMLSRYARTPMARYVLERAAEAHEDKNVDFSKWYHLNVSELPSSLQQTFVHSRMDEETEAFLNNCYEKSGWVFTQFFHSLAQFFMGFVLSMTSINGLLNRGGMFVFSNEQFKSLMDLDDVCTNATLLDLGAGDGAITKTMAKYFKTVFVTETSPSMRMRLSQRGYTVLDIDKWQERQYDVISVLNLLDRIDDPGKLINDVKLSLKPDGTLIVAIVLPYDPHVETGTKFVVPDAKLPVQGRTVEQQIKSLVENVFQPAGFVVNKFTKLPYLCEGDLYNDYFILFDFVFILELL